MKCAQTHRNICVQVDTNMYIESMCLNFWRWCFCKQQSFTNKYSILCIQGLGFWHFQFYVFRWAFLLVWCWFRYKFLSFLFRNNIPLHVSTIMYLTICIYMLNLVDVCQENFSSVDPFFNFLLDIDWALNNATLQAMKIPCGGYQPDWHRWSE